MKIKELDYPQSSRLCRNCGTVNFFNYDKVVSTCSNCGQDTYGADQPTRIHSVSPKENVELSKIADE